MTQEELCALRCDNMRRGREAIARRVAGRRDDYYWLRDTQGYGIAEAAQRIGISYRHALRWEAARDPGRGWDKALIAERKRVVRELHAQELSDSQIAAKLGMSRTGVLRIRRSLGLRAARQPSGRREDA